MALPSVTLSKLSGLRETFASARRLSKVLPTYVDAEYNNLATVVRGQFITLSVRTRWA